MTLQSPAQFHSHLHLVLSRSVNMKGLSLLLLVAAVTDAAPTLDGKLAARQLRQCTSIEAVSCCNAFNPLGCVFCSCSSGSALQSSSTTPAQLPTSTTVIISTPITTSVQRPTTTTVTVPLVTTTSTQLTTSSAGTTASTSSSTATASPGSCQAVAPSYNYKIVEGGATYTVNCGMDIPGGDLVTQSSSTFNGCFPLCDSTPGCVGFSYLPGFCYLKQSQSGFLVSSNADVAQRSSQVPGLTTTSSSVGPAPTGACSSIGSGATVDGYTTSCGTDYPGGDLANATSQSYAGCATQCDTIPGCIGFSYVGGTGSGVCYFKSSKQNAVSNSGVDSGFRSSPVIPGNPVTSTIATSTYAAPTTVATGACPFVLANPALHPGYTVSCGTDRPGGDLSNAPSASFNDCFAQCDALAGCVGFAYNGGSGSGVCFFKSSLVPAVQNSGVEFASKNTATTSSSSTSTTSTTSKASTTTSAAPSTSTAATFQLSLYSDTLCLVSNGQLSIQSAQIGQCLSSPLTHSFRYTSTGGSSCRLVAYNAPLCAGTSVTLSPGGATQCLTPYSSFMYVC
ncbi:hypothetical protein DOTSEDRAFT_80702 [Dothistroma septosporum NZE10]|uniref:Apple domain-containing protein n=1 Tax=Dothistroma septosporum (strain NZE10 / CBS 128990) TaxID=675120 RepID=M2WMG3_DOTSN|nr:hypothetical protein DOTSEDRAFT_80702 [Dothistroma septosporum NZE10]